MRWYNTTYYTPEASLSSQLLVKTVTPLRIPCQRKIFRVYLCGWVLAVSEVGHRLKEQEGIILRIIFMEKQNLNEADKFMGHVL